MVEECSAGVLGACYTHDLASNYCQRYVTFLKSNNSQIIDSIKTEITNAISEITRFRFSETSEMIVNSGVDFLNKALNKLEELKEVKD